VNSQRAQGAPLSPESSTLVAIGNFDGVHRGHQAVLAEGLAVARIEGLKPLVLTFDPHPALVLGRGALPALTSLERKVELLRRQGPELEVVIEPFTPLLAKTEPADFVKLLLVEKLGARVVLVGEDFRFGRARTGDFSLLDELGKGYGFRAVAATLERDAQGPISSTRIRGALSDGDLGEVARLLGRPHALSGVVERGQGRGRGVGFPTANLGGISEALPPHGVYAVLVDQAHGDDDFAALGAGVANFGVRPTLGAGPSFEVHLFDMDRDLYGQRLRVHLLSRLREERKFAGIDELRAQIAKDGSAARALVAACKPDPSARGAWY
jgi:riboflavin kinase/FMN adenylyltransferase